MISPNRSVRAADKAAPHPYHHGRLRAVLIEETARLAAEQGLEAVTLRAVALRAGVSRAAPYHHFAGKTALLAAVAEEGFRRLDVRLRRADRAAPADDPFERLRRMGVAYIRFAVSHPQYYRVMFKPECRGPHAHVDLNTAAGRSFQHLVDAVMACRRSAGDAAADPLLWALAAWTITHGLSSLWLDGALAGGPLGRAGIRRLADRITRALTPAFQAPTPPATA